MTKIKPLKPIFLFDDQAKQKSLLSAYEQKLTALNDLLTHLEKVTETALNDDEIEILSTDPKVIVDGIKSDIRKKFPFPKAPEKKNLELLGFDFTFIDGIMSIMSPTKFKYDIKNRSIISNTKERAKLIKSCKVYTANDRQVQAFNLWSKTAESINELCELNLVNTLNLNKIKSISKGVLNHGYKDGKMIAEMNYSMLMQIH